MKIIIFYLITLFSISNIFSQNIDNSKWIDYKSSDGNFTLKYPSNFKTANWSLVNKDCNTIISLQYTIYEPIDPNNKSDSLENKSMLSIFTSKNNFYQILKESNFIEKNGFWYGDEHHFPYSEDLYSFESHAGFAMYFDDWFGINAISETSVLKKSGGVWSLAAEHYRFILYKEISAGEYLYAKGYGFSFPKAYKVLMEICNSIMLLDDSNDLLNVDYETVDQELNQVYQQILIKYKSDTQFIEKLRNAQRIWVQFRDAQLVMKFPEQDPGYYGSIYSKCVSNYLAYLTIERTKTLKEWLDGTIEGDVCAGSVKINY